MRYILILLAIVAALQATLPAAGMQPLDVAGNSAVPTACDPRSGESFAAETPAERLPAGLELAIVADQATEQWPRYARGLVVTLRRLYLEPSVISESRMTEGPLLFHIEQGSVGISINSRLTTFDAGSAVLVQTGQNYVLQNATEEPATLLRVQVVKPGDETSVAWGDPVSISIDEKESPPGPPFIASYLLLRGEMPVVEERSRMLIGCLSWPDPAADTGVMAHSGLVGYLVVHGQLLVGEGGRREAGECVVFQAGQPHRLHAGAEEPVVLVVAIVPDGEAWWGAATGMAGPRGAGSRFNFECGAQAGVGLGEFDRMVWRHDAARTRR